MTTNLDDRLNKILPRITSDDFLSGRGLGNEIAFFIFDYSPEDELRVRSHVSFLQEHIPKHKPGIRLAHVNLFDFVVEHLRERRLLEKTLQTQRAKGDDFVLRQLEKILHPQKIAPLFVEKVRPSDHDLVMISGVGSVWPILRSHTLLNNLHPVMGSTPLVLFYPGKYDGHALRLFGKIKSDNYYRAFRLIP